MAIRPPYTLDAPNKVLDNTPGRLPAEALGSARSRLSMCGSKKGLSRGKGIPPCG